MAYTVFSQSLKMMLSEELRQGMKIIEIAEQENIQHIVYSTAGGVKSKLNWPTL